MSCNDPVPCGDVTDMRSTTVRVGAALGAVVSVAAAGMALGHGTSSADPAGHQVRYTLTTAGPTEFDLFYLTAQPPDKAAYNADAYKYVKREKVNVDPGTPWVFETTLQDPQWAIFTVSSTTHGGQGAPNPHCEIAVDGQVTVQQDGEYNLQCQGTRW